MTINNGYSVTKEKNLIKILVARINMTNTINIDHYIYFIQFNIKESKTYTKTMQGLNIPQ